MKQKKILLDENEMPTQWYNVMPDIPNGIDPPLDPETKQPMGPEKLAAVFPMGLLEQEELSAQLVSQYLSVKRTQRVPRASVSARVRAR